MSKFLSSLLLLSTSLVGTTLAAQSMTLRGQLDEGRSTGCYYCPNVPYTIKFSETPVRSNTVDLAFYKALSSELLLTGTWNTATFPPGLDVTSVQVVSQTLSTPNTVRIGNNARITTSGATGEWGVSLLALGNGFVPLFDSALLIDPGTSLILGASPLDNGGSWRFDLPIPAASQFVGLRFWNQSALLAVDGSIYFSNPQVTLILQ